ncbi:LysE family translocator [Nocardioides jishulii]|uniref:LysE family translocator n=1 Tax=Nocardioides jishulii TaxID=2575440 RepID=A0A4U2YTX9_9ACTN|nr:LysE family translocator [Nocardioides jishulii]QCX28937.1 LysE family translocator [Nocardioides jishulii]TKI64162.1 LysE family translocator [Nocardioides jishulii]
MELAQVVAFTMVTLLFVFTPGADWAYAISAGLQHRSVTPAITGMLLGHLTATLAVAGGVAAVMAGAPALLTTLTVLGAAYLVWLGIGVLRSPVTPQEGEVVQGSALRRLAKGFGVSGLNPKVVLLFLAVLPQFADPAAAWPVPAQIMALASIHLVATAIVYTAVAVGARVVLATRPAAARAVSRFSGAAMVGIGAYLLVGQVAA